VTVLPDRLRRFLKLERARRDGAGPVDPLPDGERFRRIREPVPPTPAPDAAAIPAPPGPAIPPPDEVAGGFRPSRDGPLEVDLRRAGEQPFRRCVACHADSSVYAERCGNCGAPLGTPEQLDFNERLWASRLAEEEEERRERKRLAEERASDAAEGSRERHLATLAAAEKARVEGELDSVLPGTSPWARGGVSAGVLAFRRLTPRARVGLVAGLVVAVLLTATGRDRGLGIFVFLGVLLLFLRRSRRP
jgi:hypothetical protein